VSPIASLGLVLKEVKATPSAMTKDRMINTQDCMLDRALAGTEVAKNSCGFYRERE
jgi:hypothetical protein